MRYGLDIRRVHADTIGGTNVVGAFTFTGYATQNPATVCTPSSTVTCPVIAPSGYGFADFLLGLPQQSTIQAATEKTYLRANVFDWYAQDDWRVKANLTLNVGLRYEYFSPYVEKDNRLREPEPQRRLHRGFAGVPGCRGWRVLCWFSTVAGESGQKYVLAATGRCLSAEAEDLQGDG